MPPRGVYAAMKLLCYYLALPVCLLLSCEAHDGTGRISEVRSGSRMSPDQPAMTEAQRFGLEPAPTPDPSASPLDYVLPKGWSLGPTKPMRELNFTIAVAPEIECYVMMLNGDGGGIEANVNRWRQQMGQPPIAKPEIDRLKRQPMFNGNTGGVLVEISGDYEGMDGTKRTDQALIGMICQMPEPQRTIFVKMVGPAKSVASQREAFLELCKSMRVTETEHDKR